MATPVGDVELKPVNRGNPTRAHKMMPKARIRWPLPVEPRSTTSVVFRGLRVYAFGHQTDYQRTVSNFLGAYASMLIRWSMGRLDQRVDILHGIDGIVRGGEMLLVLGNPGSGCTTLLKSLSGHTGDIIVDEQSVINFQGVSSKQMSTEFRGRSTYQAEFDIHFPTLTIRETLDLASKARKHPKYWDDCPDAVDKQARTLGLGRALDTQMGGALLPGVSGGERKRTTIAEILLGDSVFQCWDNSTRGLDSVNALDFVKALRQRTSESGSAAVVTLYQAGEDIYTLFDKVLVLHEGRQIYFGSTQDAKRYFTDQGFNPATRSSTPEFLTSVTRPLALRPSLKVGFSWAPQSSKDFEEAWKSSTQYTALAQDLEAFNQRYPPGDRACLRAMRTKITGSEEKMSPFIISIRTQISLCVNRGFLRLRHNLAAPISNVMGNLVISLILGSMFYNMPNNTNSFFGRGVLLFFTSLVNTTLAAFESVALWDDRPVIEKQSQYRFYHPFTEAAASWVCDLPTKMMLTLTFNLPLYFLSNLRRTPAAFFIYYLFGFLSLLNGSLIYRSMGAMSRTLAGSQPPGAVLVTLLTLYSGFVVPFRDMRPWLQWFSYINPVYYAFEAMVINEFSGRQFDCAELFPAANRNSSHFICSSPGAIPGELRVSGDAYIEAEFGFVPEHLWRNFGILIAILVFAAGVYLIATEYITMLPPRADVLLYQRGHLPSPTKSEDLEGGHFVSRDDAKLLDASTSQGSAGVGALGKSRGAHLMWRNLSYVVKEKKKSKTILHDIDGWVKPGTLTALMGPSGAGKTTLLNVLAERTSVGIVKGDIMVGAKHQNVAFARKIGYVQQDDIHLETTSVREALTFSALLRQPAHFSRGEKLLYVDEVIHMLDMSMFQHAVVSRLNIEQRKRVTIGTELAARPELLLFLDEPTSGLDSDSAWSFCNLLRRLSDNGQAILCTIHQPSSPLLGLFDRVLLLNQGRTMYFGDLGPEFCQLVEYFEGHGSRKCLSHENPAEWMMEVTSDGETDPALSWANTWKDSNEYRLVREECGQMEQRLANLTSSQKKGQESRATEFAAPQWTQLIIVIKRAFQHDWRSPAYIYSKSLTTFGTTFVNGVSFWASGNTSQDTQNQVFSLFLLLTLFGTHVQLIMARFSESRNLYETRERQSRSYSWVVFVTANIVVELVSQTVMSVICFVSWYYPLGLWRKALDQDELHSRSGLVFLLVWSLLILFQTFSQMLMTVMPNIPTGINLGNVFFMLSLIFSGVLVPPNDLPRFWIWMYRATPLSYYVSAIMGTGLSGVDIECSSDDLLRFDPPEGLSCASYIGTSGDFALLNPEHTSACEVCVYTTADSLLSYFGIDFDDRWWQWGVTVAYNIFNIALTYLLYWLTQRGSRGNRGGA